MLWWQYAINMPYIASSKCSTMLHWKFILSSSEANPLWQVKSLNENIHWQPHPATISGARWEQQMVVPGGEGDIRLRGPARHRGEGAHRWGEGAHRPSSSESDSSEVIRHSVSKSVQHVKSLSCLVVLQVGAGFLQGYYMTWKFSERRLCNLCVLL